MSYRYLLQSAYVLLLLLTPVTLRADSVSMRDYNLLTRGMNEAEILYRLGPSDHETVTLGYYNDIVDKTWYYIPTPAEVDNRQWITEIHFDHSGRVSRLERYRGRH